jgi:hypothetical protein
MSGRLFLAGVVIVWGWLVAKLVRGSRDPRKRDSLNKRGNDKV